VKNTKNTLKKIERERVEKLMVEKSTYELSAQKSADSKHNVYKTNMERKLKLTEEQKKRVDDALQKAYEDAKQLSQQIQQQKVHTYTYT
jgi:putative cell wall-binding protein